MNTIVRTLTATTLAIALIGATMTLTTTSAEAGPKFSGGVKGVSSGDLGSGR